MILEIEGIVDYTNKITNYLKIPKELMLKFFDILPEPFNNIAMGFSVVVIAIIIIKVIRG